MNTLTRNWQNVATCVYSTQKQTGFLHVLGAWNTDSRSKGTERQHHCFVDSYKWRSKHKSVPFLFVKCDSGDHSSGCVYLLHPAERVCSLLLFIDEEPEGWGGRDHLPFNNTVMWSASLGKQDAEQERGSQRGRLTSPKELLVTSRSARTQQEFQSCCLIFEHEKELRLCTSDCCLSRCLCNSRRENISTRNLKPEKK